MKLTSILILGWLGLFGLGCQNNHVNIPQNVSYTFSFENGLEGWTPKAYDVTLDSETVDWFIQPSSERATAGDTALKFYVDNRTDAAKVFVEREFTLEPGTYDARLAFDFSTADYGDVNLWKFVASVSKQPAAGPGDLGFAADTGTGLKPIPAMSGCARTSAPPTLSARRSPWQPAIRSMCSSASGVPGKRCALTTSTTSA